VGRERLRSVRVSRLFPFASKRKTELELCFSPSFSLASLKIFSLLFQPQAPLLPQQRSNPFSTLSSPWHFSPSSSSLPARPSSSAFCPPLSASSSTFSARSSSFSTRSGGSLRPSDGSGPELRAEPSSASCSSPLSALLRQRCG
jgi:hypothetical protein